MLSLNKNWNLLIKPSKIIYDGKTNDDKVANIIIEPLERGFGLTIGNALRRILLSSIQGAAITAIKIPGVVHEFSSRSGIKEDLVDIILNIKKIGIRVNSSEKKIIRLKAKGPCVVTAGMITTGFDVDILNPGQVICTLSKDSELEMEFYCETGKGYVPAGSNKPKHLPIGVISIDALFNPVKRVSYKVEDTRVHQITDYDKLIMNIETDGSITPEMAVALAAKILQDQLQLFITFKEEEDDKEEEKDELKYDPILLQKVLELDFLSVRAKNCFKNANIVYIGDLVTKTEESMLGTQNFGRKSLNELKDILAKHNLKFGMDIKAWPPKNIEELASKYASE